MIRKVPTLILACAIGAIPVLTHAQTVTDVHILNPIEDPVNAQTPADSLPFVATLSADFADQQKAKQLVFAGLTPAGYYLIVDHISVFSAVPVGQRVWANAKAYNPGVAPTLSGFIAVPMSFQGTDHLANGTSIADIYDGNPSVSMFVPYLWNLRVNVVRNQNDGPGYAYVTLQGHLARVPPASGPRGQ